MLTTAPRRSLSRTDNVRRRRVIFLNAALDAYCYARAHTHAQLSSLCVLCTHGGQRQREKLDRRRRSVTLAKLCGDTPVARGSGRAGGGGGGGARARLGRGRVVGVVVVVVVVVVVEVEVVEVLVVVVNGENFTCVVVYSLARAL